MSLSKRFNYNISIGSTSSSSSFDISGNLRLKNIVGSQGYTYNNTPVSFNLTTPSSISWVSRTSAANNNWTSIAWSSTLGLFIAVSSTGSGNRVMTSPDGTNWTTRSSAADNSWSSVMWVPELSTIVAVSSTGSGNQIMTSTDGITWETPYSWITSTTPADNNWTSVEWNG
jgi:hypothetical protein